MSHKDESWTQGSKIFVFKNGYWLIVKKFEIPPNKDGTPFEIVDLPANPVHGTFSIQTTSNGKFCLAYSMVIIRYYKQIQLT